MDISRSSKSGLLDEHGSPYNQLVPRRLFVGEQAAEELPPLIELLTTALEFDVYERLGAALVADEGSEGVE